MKYQNSGKEHQWFDQANQIISELTTTADPDSFYRLVDVSSADKKKKWELGGEHLLRIADEASVEKKFYFEYWAADIYIALSDFKLAVETKPSPAIGTRSSAQIDTILSLRFALGEEVTGKDVATLFGPRFTKFGKENIANVTQLLDLKIKQIQQKERRDLLKEWLGDASVHPIGGMNIFNGHASYIITKVVKAYNFSLSPTAESCCINLMRDAENTFREERDIPRIGEGWVAETALYYQICKAFPDDEVIQHGVLGIFPSKVT
jgi:hypothetical protein